MNEKGIYYACIAKGPTILAEYTTSTEENEEDPKTLKTIAQQCVDRTPPNHSMFSHTVRKRTYTFLIGYPFSYFAIFDDSLPDSDSLSFLHRVKASALAFLASNSDLDLEKISPLCFQDRFLQFFAENVVLGCRRNPSFGSVVGNPAFGMRSLPVTPSDVLVKKKKKKRLLGGGGGCIGGGRGEVDSDRCVEECSDGVCKLNNGGYGKNAGGYEHGNGVLSKEASILIVQKSGGGGGSYFVDGTQKAKQVWKKHVWVVLGLDLIVCAVMFGVWLWICRGFKCIDD